MVAHGFENSGRITELIKVKEAYHIYKRLVVYYGISNILKHAGNSNELDDLEQNFATAERGAWTNIGGQLMPEASLQQLLLAKLHRQPIGQPRLTVQIRLFASFLS